MMAKSPYNLHKCTSASSLTGCIHQYLPKDIVSLPTKTEHVDVSEKTLIRRFS